MVQLNEAIGIMRSILLVISLFIGHKAVYAQDSIVQPKTGSQIFMDLQGHYGVILIHSRDLVPVRHSQPRGIILDIGRHRLSKTAWEHCLCYPRSGLSISFWDFNQSDILGQAFTAQYFVEPQFRAWQLLSFSIRGGIGMAYHNKPYHPVTNPLNLAYSTRAGISAQLGVKAEWRMSSQWWLHGGIFYNHVSNGGVKDPNKGINWPTAALGARYYPKSPVFYREKKRHWKDIRSPMKRLEMSFYLGFQEPESKKYLFSPGLEGKYSYQIGRVSAFTVGGEGVYHLGSRYLMDKDSIDLSPLQIGISVGHEFLLGKFTLGQQFGYYVYRPYRVKDDVFQRYTLGYRMSRHLVVGSSLKVYRYIADLLDIRVGWVF